MKMRHTKATWMILSSALILWAVVSAVQAEETADEIIKPSYTLTTTSDDSTRGQGHSQQYHYQSSPGHGWVDSGISADIGSGLIMAVGAIILLLAFAGIIYPLLSSGKGSSGGGWGWEGDAGASAGNDYGGWSRSYGAAKTAESVLSAVDKLYDAYKKRQ